MADAEAVPDGNIGARLVTPVPGTPAPPSPAAPAPAPAAAEMTLVDHLTELRGRLVKSLIAVALGTAVGFWFWKDIRNILIAPLPTGDRPGAGPGRRVRHRAPDLDRHRDHPRDAGDPVAGLGVRRAGAHELREAARPPVDPDRARCSSPSASAIAYFVLAPATQFLLAFTDDVLVANLAAGPYFDFVTTMFLVFGLIMEFPILLYGLSRVGIVTSRAALARRGARSSSASRSSRPRSPRAATSSARSSSA